MVYIIQNTEDFNSKISEVDSNLIVIDFYADWCGPCKNIESDFNKMSDYYGDNVMFLKINVDNDDCTEICQKFEIVSMPTFVFLSNYKNMINYRIEGADIDQINNNIQQLLSINDISNQDINSNNE